MTVERKITLAYGIMSDAIHEQLDAYKLNYSKEAIERYEKCLSGLFQSRMARIVTDSEYSKILQRLNTKVMEHINSVN